jgi:hypothetical protein
MIFRCVAEADEESLERFGSDYRGSGRIFRNREPGVPVLIIEPGMVRYS